MNRRRVLIETSWNVKRCENLLEIYWSLVLIETSWNVKFDITGYPVYVGFGINRNIVECKDTIEGYTRPSFLY